MKAYAIYCTHIGGAQIENGIGWKHSHIAVNIGWFVSFAFWICFSLFVCVCVSPSHSLSLCQKLPINNSRKMIRHDFCFSLRSCCCCCCCRGCYCFSFLLYLLRSFFFAVAYASSVIIFVYTADCCWCLLSVFSSSSLLLLSNPHLSSRPVDVLFYFFFCRSFSAHRSKNPNPDVLVCSFMLIFQTNFCSLC